MNRSYSLLATAALLLLFTPTDADAQSRFQIGFNVGAQAAGDGLSDRFEFERFTETATSDVDYGADPGVTFDGSFGVRLYKALGAAVAVSRFTRDGAAHVDARIPHPFFDNRHRAIAGDQSGVTRAETGVHLQATYTVHPSGPLAIVLSAGPSIVNVDQEFVTVVRYSESYPFDDAAFVAGDTRRAKASGVGFNAGADVTWMVAPHVGIGGMLRFTRAPVDLDVESRTIPVDAGGVAGGAGVRLLF